MLAGEVGLGALFREVGEEGSLAANEVEGGGTTDFVEGLTEEFFFPFDPGCLEELEQLALLGPAGSHLGQGIHGIAANLFRRVLKKGKEPLANGLLEGGLVGLGKTGAHGPD